MCLLGCDSVRWKFADVSEIVLLGSLSQENQLERKNDMGTGRTMRKYVALERDFL
jgi:hypothetical protein